LADARSNSHTKKGNEQNLLIPFFYFHAIDISMKNHWLHIKGKRDTIQELNQLLKMFIGFGIDPIDELFLDMRNEVVKFFRNHKDKLKFFTNGIESFDYNFEIEEKNGIVTNVVFTVDS